jgi:mitochondrial fission protein ELM1
MERHEIPPDPSRDISATAPELKLTSCWVVTDGKAGMESQCLGLAEALDLTPEIKRIHPRFPWSALPPQLWARPLQALAPDGDALTPPWPDLVIATGRATVAPAAAIKRRNPATIVVQIQKPTIAPSRFDLVIAPAHDQLDGANVISTLGALHRVTPRRLEDAAETFRERFAALPRPLIGVLIGGANRQYRLTATTTARLGSQLAAAAKSSGGGLAMTPSRRTGADNLRVISAPLDGLTTDIWDGEGDNPYFGILALADTLIVTSDSVNMVTEACATGKPVHIFDLDGGSAKFRRFHAALREHGMTRPFTGTLESWSYTPPDDMARAAAAVRKLL